MATRASAAKIAEEISALEPVVRHDAHCHRYAGTDVQVDVLINSAGVCVEWKHRIKNHNDRERDTNYPHQAASAICVPVADDQRMM